MQHEAHEPLPRGEVNPIAREALPTYVAKEFPKLDASIALWLILFVFGGGLLALYYAGIGYFPEFSWQDALTFMALMTIIGGSLLVAYSFLLLVPGVIWSEFLICNSHLHYLLMMGHQKLEPCVWSITKKILFPFALFMMFCHFLLYEEGPAGLVPLGAAASLVTVTGLLVRNLQVGLMRLQQRAAGGHAHSGDPKTDPNSLNRHRLFVAACHLPLLGAFMAKARKFGPPLAASKTGVALLWVLALLPLISFAVILLSHRIGSSNRRLAPKSTTRDPDRFSLLCRAVLAFGSAALLSLMALWFFHYIYKGRAPGLQDGIPWELLVLCTLVVIVTNLLVSVLFHEHRRPAIFTSFLAALLLLGAGHLLGEKPQDTLSARIMERFGFGGPSVRLVLTERGGRLLCQHGIPVHFEKRSDAPDRSAGNSLGDAGEHDHLQTGASALPEKGAKDKPREEGLLARADNLTILSRLGTQVFLRLDDGQTITLPKEEVLSWSTLSNTDKQTSLDDCHPPTEPRKEGALFHSLTSSHL